MDCINFSDDLSYDFGLGSAWSFLSIDEKALADEHMTENKDLFFMLKLSSYQDFT